MYLAYNFIDLHVAEYKKGKNVIKIEVYKHSDPTMAFGIYSTERSPSFRFQESGFTGIYYNRWRNRISLRPGIMSRSGHTLKMRVQLKSAESLAHIVADLIPRKV